MKSKLFIKPLSNIWMNCYLNNMYSLILSEEPSYYDLLLENDYTYAFLGRVGWYKCLTLSKHKVYEICKKLNIWEMLAEGDIIEEIAQHIIDGCAVMATVDLYEWLPLGLDYHKRHLLHDTMIGGFDSGEQLLYVFDDDINGYAEHTVSYNTFLGAYSSHTLKIVKLPKNFDPYKLEVNTLKENAEFLVHRIDSLCATSIWNIFDRYDMLNDLIIEMTKIHSRAKVNGLLVERVFGNIDEFITLKQIAEQTVIIWEQVKSTVIKCQLRRGVFDFKKVNYLSFRALEYERSFWENFAALCEGRV